MADAWQGRKLSAAERTEVILTELHRAGFASVTALSEALGVSDMTIRRDIRRLARDGELRMVHGGASLPHGNLRTATFAGRAEQAAEAKQSIAEAAIRLIGPTTTIAIDSGTTCYAVSTMLDRDFGGCVITHSIPVLQQMVHYRHATVIGLGGELMAENQVLLGTNTTAAAAALSIDVFFLGANSIDERGVYLHGNRERAVKSALMDSASRVVLLIDSSKTERTAPVRLAELDRITTLITDRPLPRKVHEACAKNRVDIVVAESSEAAGSQAQ
jgi:DeoR family transcriptional regulator, fructose operon transcriptional repressor